MNRAILRAAEAYAVFRGVIGWCSAR